MSLDRIIDDKLDTQKIKPMPLHGDMAAILRDGEKNKTNTEYFKEPSSPTQIKQDITITGC